MHLLGSAGVRTVHGCLAILVTGVPHYLVLLKFSLIITLVMELGPGLPLLPHASILCQKDIEAANR
eukprot:2948251-Amphidinium_carterae.1